MASNFKEEMVIALFLERYPELNIDFKAVSEFYTVLVFNL